MGDGGALNLREVLRQLGIKDVSELPVLKAIQPTLPIGDVSALSPSLLPPTAWVGGASAGSGATYSTCSIKSLGAGGCYIRFLECSTNANATFAWSVSDSPLTLTATTACVPQNMAPDPILSTAQSGTTGSILPTFSANTGPNVQVLARTTIIWPDVFYIPRGWTFEMQVVDTSTRNRWAAVIQDVPVAALTPSG